jgi:hypothetical protein
VIPPKRFTSPCISIAAIADPSVEFVFLTLLGRRPDVAGHDPMTEYQTQRLEYLSE